VQLNVYIPKDREHLLVELAQQAERAGKSKNELILEAIERQVASSRAPQYQTFELGAGHVDRGDLYDDGVG
jgi:hypothetical protein